MRTDLEVADRVLRDLHAELTGQQELARESGDRSKSAAHTVALWQVWGWRERLGLPLGDRFTEALDEARRRERNQVIVALMRELDPDNRTHPHSAETYMQAARLADVALAARTNYDVEDTP